ncbi:MAG: transglutaminase family protein [Sporichthyaceae bacterium]
MRRCGGSLGLTVVCLGAVALASLPLFAVVDGATWFWRSALGLAAVAAVGAAGRAVGCPRPAIPAAQVAVLALYLAALAGRTDDAGGWTALREHFAVAFGEFGGAKPPVASSESVVVLMVAGVALVGVLVDALAASYRLTGLAGLPLLALYLVPAAAVPGGVPPMSFVLPAVGYLLLLSADGERRLAGWGVAAIAGTDPDRGRGDRVRLGLGVGAAAIALAVAVPALAPQPSAGAVGAWGSTGEGGRAISTLDPLVDLRRNLILPREGDLMVVRTSSARPAELYLRAVTLDSFDGVQWTAARRTVERFDAALPDLGGRAAGVSSTAVVTEVDVLGGLRSDYVPLPSPATRLDIPGSWRVDPRTANVVSRSGADQIAGTTYSVRSLDLDPAPGDVRDEPPGPELADYLQLPADLPQRVRDLADSTTAAADGVLAKALALQQWFRDPANFAYSLEPGGGTGTDAILEFLDDRRGYCQQFASTMAVMARHLGIAARVSVGFTAGRLADDGLSRVIGTRDAHAWPELFLPGVGWTRFEPTPGSASSTPSAPAWLDPADDGTDQATAPSKEEAEPSGASPDREGPQAQKPQAAPDAACDSGASCSGRPLPPRDADVPEADATASNWPVFAGVGALALAALAVPRGLRLALRRRRWRAASAPAASTAAVAETAWREVRDTCIDLGLEWPAARTPRQTAADLTIRCRLDARTAARLSELLELLERTRYSRHVHSPPAARVRTAVEEVALALRAATRRPRRAAATILPRSLLPGAWTGPARFLRRRSRPLQYPGGVSSMEGYRPDTTERVNV